MRPPLVDIGVDGRGNAIAAFEQVLAANPVDLENQHRISLCQRLLGDIYGFRGDYVAAEKSYSQALRRTEERRKE